MSADVDNSVGEIVRTGVQSKKNPITVFKRALNKHSKTAIDFLATVMEDETMHTKFRVEASKELLKLHGDMLKAEAADKARNKEFAAKHHELLVSIQRNGGIIVDDSDEDSEDSPLLDFENISEID